jgi:hypothetical protein
MSRPFDHDPRNFRHLRIRKAVRTNPYWATGPYRRFTARQMIALEHPCRSPEQPPVPQCRRQIGIQGIAATSVVAALMYPATPLWQVSIGVFNEQGKMMPCSEMSDELRQEVAKAAETLMDGVGEGESTLHQRELYMHVTKTMTPAEVGVVEIVERAS